MGGPNMLVSKTECLIKAKHVCTGTTYYVLCCFQSISHNYLQCC